MASEHPSRSALRCGAPTLVLFVASATGQMVADTMKRAGSRKPRTLDQLRGKPYIEVQVSYQAVHRRIFNC